MKTIEIRLLLERRLPAWAFGFAFWLTLLLLLLKHRLLLLWELLVLLVVQFLMFFRYMLVCW